MEIVFFGTANAIPTKLTGHTSFLITTREPARNGTTLLFDVVDTPVQSMMMLDIDPLTLDGVILTHYHADHISAFPALLSTYNCMARSKPLIVVTNSTTEDVARRLIALLKLGADQLSFPLYFRRTYQDEAMTVRLSSADHSVPTSMTRVESTRGTLFYTSDTVYNRKIADEARDCDMLIHEATAPHSRIVHLPGHSSAQQAGMTAQAARAGSLFLCHICYQDYDGESAIVGEARAAFDGPVVLPRLMVKYTVKGNQ